MKDFKKFSGGDRNRGGNDRNHGGRQSFGGKPGFNKFGNGSGNDRPMMHKAVCSDCGKTCEVPFRPTGDKPVFCNNCFGDKREGGSFNKFEQRPAKRDFGSDRSSQRDNGEARPDRRIDDLAKQVESLHAKFDRLMEMMKVEMRANILPLEMKQNPAPAVSAKSPKAKPVAKAAVKSTVKPVRVVVKTEKKVAAKPARAASKPAVKKKK